MPDAVYLLNDLHCVIRLCGLGDDDDIEITGLQGLPAGVRAEVNRSELCLSASAGRSGLDTPVYVDLSDGRQVAFMLCY